MKKFGVFMFCILVLSGGLLTRAFSQELGDVDEDGGIDIIDALLVAQYYVNLNPPQCNPDFADVNCDGGINIIDALLISQYYVGAITEFPGCDSPTPVLTPIPTEAPLTTPDPTPEPTEDTTPAPTQVIPPSENITWEILYGGTNMNKAEAVAATVDGGYITANTSDSTDIAGCTNHGAEDYYIVKFDGAGVIEWQVMTGGSGADLAEALAVTSDNGFLIAGYSNSTDIPGLTNQGSDDILLVKLDSYGTIEWQKMFGGNSNERVFDIKTVPGNGYILTGASSSTNIPGCTNHGYSDCYVVKLDNSGNIEWQAFYGGNNSDCLYSVDLTPDNGYIVAGDSGSSDIEGCVYMGDEDCYVIKLDETGSVEWQQFYGGNDYDEAFSVRCASDGGYILAGNSSSTDIPGCTLLGSIDYWALRISDSGGIEWQKFFGGSESDIVYTMEITPDNGYIIGGFSYSTDIPGCENRGYADILLVKYDSAGTVLWQDMIGGNDVDSLRGICVLTEDSFVTAGYTSSTNIEGYPIPGGFYSYLVKVDVQ